MSMSMSICSVHDKLLQQAAACSVHDKLLQQAAACSVHDKLPQQAADARGEKKKNWRCVHRSWHLRQQPKKWPKLLLRRLC